MPHFNHHVHIFSGAKEQMAYNKFSQTILDTLHLLQDFAPITTSNRLRCCCSTFRETAHVPSPRKSHKNARQAQYQPTKLDLRLNRRTSQRRRRNHVRQQPNNAGKGTSRARR